MLFLSISSLFCSFLLSGGICAQSLPLPAQSVWCVHCLRNGDFVVGARYSGGERMHPLNVLFIHTIRVCTYIRTVHVHTYWGIQYQQYIQTTVDSIR